MRREKRTLVLDLRSWEMPLSEMGSLPRCETPWQQFSEASFPFQSFLIAVVVPDPDVLPSFAAKIGVKGSFEELCHNQVVKEAILEDLQKIGKENGLKSFEQVKYIYLHPEPFSIENGLLTPTMKSKRANLAKYFQTQINSMYEDTQL